MVILDDTIAAIATPPGGACYGMVRVAGLETAAVLSQCFQPDRGQQLSSIQTPTHLRGRFDLHDLGRRIGCDVYFWPTERSFCRCPLAEIYTLGSPPLLAAVLRTVCAGGRARVAEPGEFTLRAFLGGRIDLAQAEAVLGVIDARAEQEFQVALNQLAGGLSRPLTDLRGALLDTLAHLEAGLDFVEEQIEFVSRDEIQRSLHAALAGIESLAHQMASRTDAAHALKVVLLGAANAGKSSLFNALLCRSPSSVASPALVSAQAGTTRDYLSARLTLHGVACDLIDTAGLHDRPLTACPDGRAQSMSQQQIAGADIEVVCVDASVASSDWMQRMQEAQSAASRIVALTKCDLPRAVPAPRPGSLAVIETSSATGLGLNHLEDAIRTAAGGSTVADAKVVAATAQRCRASLNAAASSLCEAQRLNQLGEAEELLAVEIREALQSLGQVTGAVYTDDILDRIFSRFCIGK